MWRSRSLSYSSIVNGCGIILNPLPLFRRLRHGGLARGAQLLNSRLCLKTLANQQTCGHKPGAANPLPAMQHDVATCYKLRVELRECYGEFVTRYTAIRNGKR